MSDLTTLTAADLGAKIAARETTATEAAEQHFERIEKENGELNAFLHLDKVGALFQAADVDARIASGEKLGPLAGVPLALKDVVVQKGIPTTVGSKILEGWRPPYDATVVTKLKDAGVVILGKTNMDEF